MTKRILAALCALIMMLSLAACGNQNDKSSQENQAEEETAASEKETSAEDVFDKAFEADKTYDIQGMAEVEYSINFGKSADKDALVKKAQDGVDELSEDTLKAYKERIAGTTYVILEKLPLEGKELENRIAQLEPRYRDTDKITEIDKITYQVFDSNGNEVNSSAVEMIKVDGTWYCYMGEDRW